MKMKTVKVWYKLLIVLAVILPLLIGAYLIYEIDTPTGDFKSGWKVLVVVLIYLFIEIEIIYIAVTLDDRISSKIVNVFDNKFVAFIIAFFGGLLGTVVDIVVFYLAKFLIKVPSDKWVKFVNVIGIIAIVASILYFLVKANRIIAEKIVGKKRVKWK